MVLTFDRPPSLWRLYPRVLVARKPSRVGEGRSVPRLEGKQTGVRIDPAHLAAYRALCGFGDGAVPLTYPHVLASGLHLAMLSSAGFPVRLLGLVHVASRIEQQGPLPSDASGALVAWLEGHQDTPRGQTFELHTEWQVDGAVPWRETMTFLARGPRRDGAKAPAERPASRAPDAQHTFDAPADVGRRYGVHAGDVNPIHLWATTARLFGFPRAIAHGMWSLARCLSLLPAEELRGLEVQFKLPVLLPATLVLERRGDDFTLLDGAREKPHLAGRLVRAH